MGFDASQTRAWATIDRGALVRNLARLRQLGEGRRVIGVVKADGYGHGAVEVARTLRSAGCDAQAVATLDEARELRAAGVDGPLLLLTGLLHPEQVPALREAAITPVVSRLADLDVLAAASGPGPDALDLHLKLDTGMGRLGLAAGELDEALAKLRGADGLRLDGFMTHLAEADDAAGARTSEQRDAFAKALAQVRAAGFDPSWVHCDNSAGIVHGPTPETNAVRPGLALYGPDPTLEGRHAFEPVMSLWARVCHVKEVSAGTPVGYGGAWRAPRDTRLATLAIGYADGLPRAAGDRFAIGLRGRRVPLVGRVSCDLCCADVGPDSRVAVGDAALIFGRAEGLTIPVRELAEAIGTISYEILVRIGPRIPRLARD